MHVAYVGKVSNVRNPLYRIGRSRPFHLLRNVPARHLIRSARREVKGLDKCQLTVDSSVHYVPGDSNGLDHYGKKTVNSIQKV